MNFETIRNEVESIYRDFKTINNDLFFTGLGKSKTDWTRLYLKWFKKIDPIGAKLCPQTTDIVQSMPNIQTAMISVLKPGAKIVPHKGPYSGCIRLHMGLITPNNDDCFINLDGKSYSWRDGEVILLDDSYLHYVENNTKQYRVILFCDIVRPMNFIGDMVNNFLINNLSEYTHREN
jgi:beta-hydroxylase